MTNPFEDIIVVVLDGIPTLIGASERGQGFLRRLPEALLSGMSGPTALVPVEALEAVFEAIERDSLTTLTFG